MSKTAKKQKKGKKDDNIYSKIFRLYDDDNDGYVNISSLSEMMRSAGAIFLDSDLDKSIEKAWDAFIPSFLSKARIELVDYD